MNHIFRTWKVNEPNLLFGDKSPTTDPRFGILNHGPYSSIQNKEKEIINVKIGIIGSKKSIKNVSMFLKKLKEPLPPNNVTTGVFGFPGLGKESPFCMNLSISQKYQEIIAFDIIEEILRKKNRIERLGHLLNSYNEKLKNLGKKDPPPHVVLCALSNDMINKCKRPGFKTKRLIFRDRRFKRKRGKWRYDSKKESKNHEYNPSSDYNFHNVLKIIGMEENLPTQIIYQDVWEKGLLPKSDRPHLSIQDRVTLAWNFTLALFYKASGIPWKFTNLGKDTLYAGIEFFPEISSDNQVMRASMAQIFLQTGESFILRGDAFDWDYKKKDLSPHLSFDQAEALCENILSQYFELQGKEPKRIVIHKSSNYYDEELNGFLHSTQHIKKRDFLTIISSPLRFFRDGKEPPVRGTVISTTHDHFLFTTGFTPTLMQYPGKGIPEPITIRPFQLDSSLRQICQEILALTKLDWNNIYYNTRLPVTLSIAGKVGEILSEPRAKELKKPLIQYRYYM